jgi:aspartyl-tRNA(Asn)/glutamyl-tRNA(Gln) amidotransferase subunit A
LTDLGVKAIRDGVAAGEFTAREVAEAFNANVAAAQGALNAFIVATPEKALEAADRVDADRAAGKPLGAMAGVPIGMKDLFATRGVQTTAGSHILEGFVPEYESTVSQKLWDAGAGMLGKLNMDQFAMGSSNETSYFGNVVSPWRRKHGGNAPLAPGGSSGGSSTVDLGWELDGGQLLRGEREVLYRQLRPEREGREVGERSHDDPAPEDRAEPSLEALVR